MAPQTILVVGATGKLGTGAIKALLNSPEYPQYPGYPARFHVLALTRKDRSTRAKDLREAVPFGTMSFIEGDSTNPQPIFDSEPRGSITGLFLSTTLGADVSEEQQAIPLINAAVKHGVKHIVFSSVDRGGDERSWTNPTTIKHFRAKHNIEIYLRDKAEKYNGKFTWTILRPVAFLDNMTPGIMCSLFTAV
jgi:uncharacterized protein YbjT (DUF2867 family)